MKVLKGLLAASALRALVGRAANSAVPGRASRLPVRFAGLQRMAWPPRGLGTGVALALFLGTGATGFVLGGHLDQFHADHGRLIDLLARTAGFGIEQISVAGNKEMSREEIVAVSGITSRDSVAFLDVGAVRQRLKDQPLVAEAEVRKLFPDQIALSVTERLPFALWQLDGNVKVVSIDGTVIDDMRDDRFLRLPHVVGTGANLRAKQYAALLDAVPEIRPLVRAGILISERRWTLKLTNGVDVKLPEEDAAAALRKLALLNQTDRVLSKDILSVDLRVPGRVAFRLSEEAASARNDALDKKFPKAKGRA